MPKNSRTPVRVISSAPLPDQQLQQIEQKAERICHGPVALEQALDPKVISGFRLELPDCVVDCTLDTYLEEIKKQMINDDGLL